MLKRHRLLLVLALSALSAESFSQQTTTPAQGAGQQPTSRQQVNFQDADIEEVIKYVQNVTGKTFLVDPRVKGQLKVYSSQEVSEDELYNLFISMLEIQGFTAIEVGNVVRIIPNKEARAAPIQMGNGNDAADAYVTEVIAINNISAQQLLPSLRPLVPQHAHTFASPSGNAIVITDTAANVARIRELINQLDTSATPETEVVPLLYAEAEEVVRIITQLERNNSQAGGNAPGTPNQIQIVADKRTNAVLVTGEQRQRQRIKALIRELDTSRQQTGNVRVVYLEYAQAEQIAKVLTDIVQNRAKLTPEEQAPAGQGDASIVAEADTNALIITADVDTLNVLEQVIARLDIQRAQVQVEAIIVEINEEVGKSLGVQWLFRNDQGGFASSIKPGNNAQAIGQIAESALDTDDEDALTGLAAALAGTAGQTLGVGRLTDATDILALIDFLQANSGANILSTPNITTMDNHEASLSVGESVPFVTGSFTSTGDTGSVQNPFQTIDRQNVGTSLKVTPHINEGDRMVLEIVQEVSSISPKAGAVDLITNERTFETQLLVRDGETVVLGGLIKDNVIQNETRVPLLGSIPILGHLFRSQSTSVQKTNLMVFIKPTIIRDDETLRGATAEKYKFIRDQQLRQRDLGGLLTDHSTLPLLPEWELVVPPQKADSAQPHEPVLTEPDNGDDTSESDNPNENSDGGAQGDAIRPPPRPSTQPSDGSNQ